LGAMAYRGFAKSLDSISADEQKRIIRDYCSGHPLSLYSSAVSKLWSYYLPNSKTPMGPMQHQ
jgi:hypothetical protein